MKTKNKRSITAFTTLLTILSIIGSFVSARAATPNWSPQSQTNADTGQYRIPAQMTPAQRAAHEIMRAYRAYLEQARSANSEQARRAYYQQYLQRVSLIRQELGRTQQDQNAAYSDSPASGQDDGYSDGYGNMPPTQSQSRFYGPSAGHPQGSYTDSNPQTTGGTYDNGGGSQYAAPVAQRRTYGQPTSSAVPVATSTNRKKRRTFLQNVWDKEIHPIVRREEKGAAHEAVTWGANELGF